MSNPSPIDPSLRFTVELEFLCCLSSPRYLQFLAQNNYLTNPSFLSFLSYLQYFTNPSYAVFVHYPDSFTHLTLLLTNPNSFRTQIASDEFMVSLHQAQASKWLDNSRVHYGDGLNNSLNSQHEALLSSVSDSSANGISPNPEEIIKQKEKMEAITARITSIVEQQQQQLSEKIEKE